METNTKNTLLKGSFVLLTTLLILGGIGYGVKWAIDYWKNGSVNTPSSPLGMEQISEMAVLKFTFEHTYTWEHDWAWSSKAYVISRQYEALIGVESLNKKDFSCIKIENKGSSTDDIRISGYKVKVMSCSPISETRVLVDIGGIWNWLTAKERHSARNHLDKSAREFVENNDSLMKMAEINFINMVKVSRGVNSGINVDAIDSENPYRLR